MTIEQKYAVLKKADWDAIKKEAPPHTVEALEDCQITDVFVLRSRDVIAAPALFSYASLLQTVVEFDRLRAVLSPEEQVHYAKLADAVFELGIEWQRKSSIDGSKLPT